jgi:hypothetical protein
MSDITSPAILYLKAGLFVLGGGMAAGLLLLDSPSFRTAALLSLTVWCFARAYYFAFYVVEHYVDASFRFAGLLDFARYVLKRRFGRHAAGSGSKPESDPVRTETEAS